MWYRTSDNSVIITVRVVPKSSRAQTGPVEGDALKVKITAPPVDGQANAALVKFIAKKLGVSRSRVRIIRGETSRTKVLEVHDVDLDAVERLADG